jgi:ATP-dependent Clp protease ATP-binding subunit ClpB
MRIDKFTQKMQEAVQAAQDVASEFNQQEITNEHFLLALLDQAEGVTRPLLEKLGVAAESLKERLRNGLQRLQRVTGGNVDHALGTNTAACSTARKRRWRS